MVSGFVAQNSKLKFAGLNHATATDLEIVCAGQQPLGLRMSAFPKADLDLRMSVSAT
jgi:hypothetical protein